MLSRKRVAAFAVGGLLLCAPLAAVAQGEGNGLRETYVGRFVSTSPSCPSLDFHVVAMQDGKLHGLAFDPMMAGEMSEVTGTIAADGRVHLTMTAMHGKGPSGSADGVVSKGNLDLTMTNGACPMPKMTLMPVQKTFFDGHG